MKHNLWTVALVAAGAVSLGSLAQAEEAKNQVLTALSSTTLSGYVDTSANWQLGPATTSVGHSYDRAAKQDGFNLNVVKLTLEKPLDSSEWTAGYKVDMLFGPDAAMYNPVSPGIAKGTAQDFGLKQAYVVVRAPVGNGLDFKIGTFDTCIGYEVFESINNPNVSRSYGYFIEPLSHTGVMASYQATEWLSLSGGVADTWNTGINARAVRYNGAAFVAADQSEKTYMGLVTLTAPESFGTLKGATLTAGIVDGLPSANGLQSATRITHYYVGATVPTPLTGLAAGAAYEYRGTTGIAATYANAVAGYLTYQATEKMKLASRTEYATGTKGTWADGTAPAPTSAQPEAFLGEAFTLDYSLWQNVVTRAEVRWDRDLTGQRLMGDPPNARQNAFSLALNVVYKF